VILFALAMNLPWRATIRRTRRSAGVASAVERSTPIEQTAHTTSKDATWTALQRAMADPVSHDVAERAARSWVESIDRNERWG